MYNIKIAFRNLRRNSLYSWINIIGLAVSLTACILITLWVQDELSYDRFHKKAKNIYQVYADMGSEWGYWASTPAPLADYAKSHNPDIEQTCRVGNYWAGYFEYEGEKYFDLQGLAVDTSFFSMFNFPLLEGNINNPFPDDLSMIITEKKAKVLFGDENPIGKTLKTDAGLVFHIVGIAKNPPINSSLKFDFLLLFDVQQRTFGGNGPWKTIDEDWGNYQYVNYMSIPNGVDIEGLQKKISDQVTTIRGYDDDRFDFVLQPLLKTHLYSPDGEPQGVKTVRILIIIAILILVIACINYVNLVTSRSTKRAKEIALRKIVGADKLSLFSQLMRETLVILLIAFVIATVLIAFLMPAYRQLVNKDIIFSFTNSSVWLVYGIMAISVVVLAGLYPAFILSSFKPMDAFRLQEGGKKKGFYLRKALVIMQFMVSFVLIVITLCLNQQMKYIRHKDLGYDQENVFVMRAGNMRNHYNVVKNELLENKDILSVSSSSLNRMLVQSSRMGADWTGKEKDNNPQFFCGWIESNFCEAMDLELIEGQYLSPADTFSLLINETALKIMKMEDPIGKAFYLNEGDEHFYTIRGVLKDFNFESLNEKIKPLLLINSVNYGYQIYVRTRSGGIESALATAEKLWKNYNPDYEFTYNFLDENYERLYKTDIQTGKLLTLFAVIAIFTSCLGLFGLVTYTAETKTKEIGIRKVLGASNENIIRMLSKEFFILVGIAMLIAIPISYFAANKILQDYAFRIPIYWWIYIIAALITILLTAVSVGLKAYKSATSNPVNSIKAE